MMIATGRNGWRLAGWGGAAALLALPLVTMRVTKEVNWSAGDFVAMAALLAVAGLALELLLGRASTLAYRAGAALAVLGAFLLLWVDLAVGIIGDPNNPANLLFAGALAIAIGGALLSRGRPEGMARALAMTALAQAIIAIVGYAIGHAPLAVLGANALFVALWATAAGLFALDACRTLTVRAHHPNRAASSASTGATSNPFSASHASSKYVDA